MPNAKSIALIILVLLAPLLLIIAGREEAPMPVGATFRPLPVSATNGPVLVRPDTARVTLVVLFSIQCFHCRRQLEMFSRHGEALKDVQLVLISSEEWARPDTAWRAWRELQESAHVVCGTIEGGNARKLLGHDLLPLLLFIDRQGIVRKRFQGETKFETVMSVIGNSDLSGKVGSAATNSSS